jgi:hypothetical protein
MTIEAWNIVLSATILVLMAVGGFWLKHVVGQQLKAKDAVIEASKGVIELKDTLITSLQGNTAPAIAKDYAAMREHANQVSEDSQKKSAQLAALTERHKLAVQTYETKLSIAEARVYSESFDLIHEHIGAVLFPDGEQINSLFKDKDTFETLFENYLLVMKQINLEIGTRIKTAETGSLRQS